MSKDPFILHLETSSKNCSVSISKGEELLCLCEEISENFSHSKQLHTFVEWALEGTDITIKDLDAVSVSEGPGSYTGLRIGVSAAKGFCFALGIPLLATQTLKTLAKPFIESNYNFVISVIDARRAEVFWQKFDGKTKEELPIENLILEVEHFKDLQNKNIHFVGDGANKIKLFCEENEINISSFEFTNAYPSSQYSIQEAVWKYHENMFADLAYFEPKYIKPVHITTSKKKIFK